MKTVLRASEFWMAVLATAVHFVPGLPPELKPLESGAWTYAVGRVVSKLAKSGIK